MREAYSEERRSRPCLKSTYHSNRDPPEVIVYKDEGSEGLRAPPSPPLTTGTTRTKNSQRRAKSDLHSDSEHSENSGPYKAPKVPRIENIEKLIQRWIEEVSQQLWKEAESCGLRTFDSPLSKEITSHRFPQYVRDAELRVLLWDDRSHPAPPAVP